MERFLIKMDVCGRAVSLDVRDILSLRLEKRTEPEAAYLVIKAKCRVAEFRQYKEAVHEIRTRDNVLDILSQILERVNSFTWKEENPSP